MAIEHLIKDYKSSEDIIKELIHLADTLDMTCDCAKIKDANNIRSIIDLYITEKNWNKIISENCNDLRKQLNECYIIQDKIRHILLCNKPHKAQEKLKHLLKE